MMVDVPIDHHHSPFVESPGLLFAGVSALADINSQTTVTLWAVEAMLKITVNFATYVNVREVGKVP